MLLSRTDGKNVSYFSDIILKPTEQEQKPGYFSLTLFENRDAERLILKKKTICSEEWGMARRK